MAASGIGNPSGAVQLFDWGNPKTITAYAKQNISGGAFVYASGADNVVTATADTFVSADIKVAMDASGAQFNGIALGYAASGAAIPVAVEGVFILQANGVVTAGFPVWCDGQNAVANAGSATMDSGFLGRNIGRALTSAASGGFCVVHIK